ncbi:MAG: T9SS type A sorting domain-containing protein [Saprospiraceae bacterium]
MKVSPGLFILAAFLMISTIGRSQSYHLTVSSRPYQDLVGGTPLVTETWDDPGFSIPLGYSIDFFGQSVSTIYSPSDFTGGIFTTNLDASSLDLIIPFSVDLIDRGYNINTLMSPISFKTITVAGRKSTTIEYKNAGFIADSSSGVRTDFVNVQFTVFEGTDDVEVHIGPSSVSDIDLDFETSSGPAIGLLQGYDLNNGVVNGDVFLLDGNPLAPTIHTTFTDAYVDWPIPDGTVYTFSRQTSAVHDEVVNGSTSYYFPNPANQVVTIKPELAGKIISEVSIFNSDGVKVKAKKDQQKIDLDGFSPGIYMLRFQTEDGPAMQRICVMK